MSRRDARIPNRDQHSDISFFSFKNQFVPELGHFLSQRISWHFPYRADSENNETESEIIHQK